MLPDTMSGKGIQIHLLVMIKNKESLIARIKVKIINESEGPINMWLGKEMINYFHLPPPPLHGGLVVIINI